jgi:glyoxylase-like metal-dependent hydrolase (beta-lactamase superfamily II)
MDGTLVTKQIDDNIWTFNEAIEGSGPQVDAYLVAGSKRAVVIDTLMQETSLYAAARELCSLPMDVLITHGHPDHAGTATKDFISAGCDVYMHRADFPMLSQLGLDEANFIPLREGSVFDLGGYTLEALLMAGHTPGSLVFLEREKQHLYTGDAIGAGVFWMHLPGALPLRELRKNLGRLWEQVQDMDHLVIHPGHRHQAPRHDKEFLTDTIFVTDQIINGALEGTEREFNFPEWNIKKYRTVAYKFITDYAYNPDNI